jgi:hypothetical protein
MIMAEVFICAESLLLNTTITGVSLLFVEAFLKWINEIIVNLIGRLEFGWLVWRDLAWILRILWNAACNCL